MFRRALLILLGLAAVVGSGFAGVWFARSPLRLGSGGTLTLRAVVGADASVVKALAPGRVRLVLEDDGASVSLTIEDSAPGVPEAALPRLFDRLFRVDASRNRDAGGAGLGLAICRAIVLAHGGSIEATASTLGGLLIEVRLPALARGA